MAASYFRQSQFPAVIRDLFQRKPGVFCDLHTFKPGKPLASDFFPLRAVLIALKHTVQPDTVLYHITFYVQRFFHLHRPPSSVLCLHRHGCNISVPDHTGAGRKTPCRTPGRSSTARSSSSPALDGCCSTVTGIPVSRTSVVCLYGLVRLPYRTEGRRKKPCP